MLLDTANVGCVLIDASVSDLLNICKHSRSNLSRWRQEVVLATGFLLRLGWAGSL